MFTCIDFYVAQYYVDRMMRRSNLRKTEKIFRLVNAREMTCHAREMISTMRIRCVIGHIMSVRHTADIIHTYAYMTTHSIEPVYEPGFIMVAQMHMDRFIFSDNIVVMHDRRAIAATCGLDAARLDSLYKQFVDSHLSHSAEQLRSRPDITDNFTDAQKMLLN